MKNKKKKHVRHGKRYTKVYSIWCNIKARCYNEKQTGYENYGGRGIGMQKDWIDSFVDFEKYVTNLDSYDLLKIGMKGLTLDRKDNNGNYEKGNLRWASKVMQGRNQRNRKRNTSGYRGVSFVKNLKKYVAYIQVNQKRVYLGWEKLASEAYQLRLDYIKKHNLKGFEIEFNH